jgi:hypothetical protein
MLDKYINPIVFIVAFAFSMLVVYFMHPEPTVIYKFPNPNNADKYTYQDENKNCYKYKATEVKCPSDPNLILEHPIIIK